MLFIEYFYELKFLPKMKKKFYFLFLLICWIGALHTNAANVVPVSDVYYNIVQVSSNNIFGTVADYPAIQVPSNSLGQAYKFVTVDGMTDTYYILNGYGKYMSKAPNSDWNVVFLDAPDGNTSQWTIVDDDSSTDVFRLMIVYNSKYLASDNTTDGSRLYYDKSNTHTNGLFKIQSSAFPSDLISAYYNYTLGDLSNVTSNLDLAASIGSNIQVSWSSNRPTIISTLGVVTPLQKYDAKVVLTATMTEIVDEVTYSLTKTFVATVKSIEVMQEEIAQWDFKSDAITLNNGIINVTDTKNGFVGTVMNDARIRTIGNTDSDQFNVLDLGNGTGYFDMGINIGEAIYGLSEYSICGYYYINNDYSELSNNGNFMWTFSNSADAGTDQNGYLLGRLNNVSMEITPKYWNSQNQGVYFGSAAEKGTWHHYAYVQKETTGTLYIDGAEVATGTITNIPSIALIQSSLSLTGTPYNWLGRSNYVGDAYLRQTLLYDFRVYSVPLSVEDINLDDVVGAASTIEKLNNAYAQNADYVDNSLVTEKDNLSLGDLSAVTSNLTLPSNGTIDPTISILWKSSNNNLIDANGVVTRPDYYNYTDTLTATLFKNGQSVTKKFYATVVLKEGTAFQNNLLVKYDFSQVSSDTIITDVAEKHFQGIVKNDARVHSIGLSTKYNVLELGDSIGYFDMGLEVGKLMYNLKDFTISAYYRIDANYPKTELQSNGNFLWNFSNSQNILSTPTGYLIASLKNQAATITPVRWEDEQTIQLDSTALQGSWHNMTYTQSGTTGTLYVDGMPMATAEITQLPSTSLSKEGFLGTFYNWIGRSCYTGDVYLRKTMVYDFRIYDVALTEQQIQTTELNVGNTINALDVAYSEDATAVPSVNASLYKLASSKGVINIFGLNGTEKVSVYDISGNQVKVTNKASVAVDAGIYIVKINNFVSKVIVK
ncbi:exported hypothetical protein [uncultured Paludibacter sp.]|uniref:Atrophied bacterial Ig domain-containing protein n=1 Tax=uncultured Paludibacter sp. TaxID=497635 RepID=A0A653A9T8_9BACT|nr:exported hypothetical protein [uncultured Paludibacter sp.]